MQKIWKFSGKMWFFAGKTVVFNIFMQPIVAKILTKVGGAI